MRSLYPFCNLTRGYLEGHEKLYPPCNEASPDPYTPGGYSSEVLTVEYEDLTLIKNQYTVNTENRENKQRRHTMEKPSIYLKAYRCSDGREIHYAAARLRREGNSPTAIMDAEDPSDGTTSRKIGACWIFFYPMGPSRRLLEAIVSRYAPNFQCDKDVLFLSVNRPGKGGTTSSVEHEKSTISSSSERQHIDTACKDVVTILDHYGISRASLLYMCAGSTFAYSFASQYTERTTRYIIGVASWVLRSDQSSVNTPKEHKNGSEVIQGYIDTPPMHSLTHRLAMRGVFGPKSFVSWLAGGITGSIGMVFSSVPPAWVGKELKKDLSTEETVMFDEQYPDVEEFVAMMKWIHDDGHDDEVSVPVNGDGTSCPEHEVADAKDGNARDCAVCLSTQQDLGLIYKTTVPVQHQVLLWHGECDKMIAIEGAMYLESMISNSTLTRVADGTHQGVMFFLPEGAMEALNRISRDSHV